jgi:death-on-curing protein
VTAEPLWLEARDVLAIHDELLREFGGRPGVRDPGLLESALGSPKHHFAYGERDVYQLAAAYAHALARDHPVVDGNKRTAFMTAYVFLGVNGKVFQAAEEEVVRTMLLLAANELSKDALAEWLRGASTPARKTRPSKKAPKRPRPSR